MSKPTHLTSTDIIFAFDKLNSYYDDWVKYMIEHPPYPAEGHGGLHYMNAANHRQKVFAEMEKINDILKIGAKNALEANAKLSGTSND